MLNFYLVPNIYHAYQNQDTWNVTIELNEPEIWKFLPGFIIGLLTFFIDGFLIVYFLGKKGFCRFLCPWGAFLKIPTALSFFKVRKTGDCTYCHVCTSECPVGIDVSYEINKFDKVVSSNCTSCMNCTEGCPSNALSYKFTNPITETYNLEQFLPNEKQFSHKNISHKFLNLRKYDFLILIFTIILGLSIDGLYGIGHFMAFGISLLSSYWILIFSKKFTLIKQTFIIVTVLIIFSWHGIIKYSIWNGIRGYKAGDYQSGIQNLERASYLYPKNIGKFHIMLSEMYIETNSTVNAIKHAKIANKINPTHSAPKELLKILNIDF